MTEKLQPETSRLVNEAWAGYRRNLISAAVPAAALAKLPPGHPLHGARGYWLLVDGNELPGELGDGVAQTAGSARTLLLGLKGQGGLALAQATLAPYDAAVAGRARELAAARAAGQNLPAQRNDAFNPLRQQPLERIDRILAIATAGGAVPWLKSLFGDDLKQATVRALNQVAGTVLGLEEQLDQSGLRRLPAATPPGDLIRSLQAAEGAPCQLAAELARQFHLVLVKRLHEAGVPRGQALAALPAGAIAGRIESHLGERGLAWARGAVKPAVLQALEHTPGFAMAEYNFFAAEGGRGERRQAAARLFPVLAGMLPHRPALRGAIDAAPEPATLYPGETRAAAWEREVRAKLGAELGDLGFGKAVLKRIAGAALPLAAEERDVVLLLLAKLPPDWFPADRTQWDAFRDVACGVLAPIQAGAGLAAMTLLEGCKGNWTGFRHAIARACTDTRPPEGTTEAGHAAMQAAIDWKALDKVDAKGAAGREAMLARIEAYGEQLAPVDGLGREAVVDWLRRLYLPSEERAVLRNHASDAATMAADFASLVVLPLAFHRAGERDADLAQVHLAQARESAAQVLFAGKNLVNILEASRHFHTQRIAVQAAAAANRSEAEIRLERAMDTIPAGGWPRLIDRVQAPNGVWLCPTQTKAELEDIGGTAWDAPRNLCICVGFNGYDAKARQGEISILYAATFDAAGSARYLSCYEAAVPAYGSSILRARQHRGHRNGEPPADARAAFQWLEQEIEAGRIAVHHDVMRAFKEAANRRVAGDPLKARCGYDWRQADLILEAMKPWVRYVGKKYRQMGLEAFAATEEMRALVTLIEPSLTETARP
jgi:hypothetical protein